MLLPAALAAVAQLANIQTTAAQPGSSKGAKQMAKQEATQEHGVVLNLSGLLLVLLSLLRWYGAKLAPRFGMLMRDLPKYGLDEARHFVTRQLLK